MSAGRRVIDDDADDLKEEEAFACERGAQAIVAAIRES